MFSLIKNMKLKLSFKIDQSLHFVKPLVPIAKFPGAGNLIEDNKGNSQVPVPKKNWTGHFCGDSKVTSTQHYQTFFCF